MKKETTNEQLILYINHVEESFKRLEMIIRLLEKKLEFFSNCFITHLQDHQTGDHTKWDLPELKKEVNNDGTHNI